MVKLAYISDVHGNLQALEATLEDIRKNNVDEIVMLGDMIGDGPNPVEVVQICKRECLKNVLGNREVYCLNYLNGAEKHLEEYMQFAPAVWTAKQLNSSHIKFLESLPVDIKFNIDKTKHFLIHASPRGYRDLIFKDDEKSINEILSKLDCDVYAFGHTHQAWYENINDTLVINPGSIGLSFCEMGYTQYIIVTYHKGQAFAKIENVKYDVNTYIKSIKEQMMPHCGPWCKGIIASTILGKMVNIDFIEYAYKLARQKNCKASIVPNDVLKLADETYDWPVDFI